MRLGIIIVVFMAFILSLFMLVQPAVLAMGENTCWRVGYSDCPPPSYWYPPTVYVCVPGTPQPCGYSNELIEQGLGDCSGAQCGCCFALGEFMSCRCYREVYWF